jgi:hypothetical protein
MQASMVSLAKALIFASLIGVHLLLLMSYSCLCFHQIASFHFAAVNLFSIALIRF